MKLRDVVVNRRKKQLEMVTRAGEVYPMPFSRLLPRPQQRDPLVEAYVDRELGNEAVTYLLASGKEGSVPLDHALDYNRDPAYLAEQALHKLTVEALVQVKAAGLSKREVARRLATSVPQVYRLLDPTNYSKGFTQMLALLQVLDCDVRIVVKARPKTVRARPMRQRKAA